MTYLHPNLLPFLVRAKRATYASGVEPAQSSRLSSHDLPYQVGDWYYLDTYLGGINFIGEEGVWYQNLPVWGMNYYGWMLSGGVPEGFSQFLKDALLLIEVEAPYRGPAELVIGCFHYSCVWEGEPARFSGEERIDLEGVKIYQLNFHGGLIS